MQTETRFCLPKQNKNIIIIIIMSMRLCAPRQLITHRIIREKYIYKYRTQNNFRPHTSPRHLVISSTSTWYVTPVPLLGTDVLRRALNDLYSHAGGLRLRHLGTRTTRISAHCKYSSGKCLPPHGLALCTYPPFALA